MITQFNESAKLCMSHYTFSNASISLIVNKYSNISKLLCLHQQFDENKITQIKMFHLFHVNKEVYNFITFSKLPK